MAGSRPVAAPVAVSPSSTATNSVSSNKENVNAANKAPPTATSKKTKDNKSKGDERLLSPNTVEVNNRLRDGETTTYRPDGNNTPTGNTGNSNNNNSSSSELRRQAEQQQALVPERPSGERYIQSGSRTVSDRKDKKLLAIQPKRSDAYATSNNASATLKPAASTPNLITVKSQRQLAINYYCVIITYILQSTIKYCAASATYFVFYISVVCIVA